MGSAVRVCLQNAPNRTYEYGKGCIVKRAMILLTAVLVCATGGPGLAGAQDNEPTMTLHAAARAGDLEQLKAHIARGANLDQQDELGFTPIYCAVSAVRLEAARLLLDSRANPNGSGPDGLTPLIVASSIGRKDLIELLLAKGANIEWRDRQQRTALHVAVSCGQLEVVKVLVNAGADVNGAGRGQTPLSIAMQRNKTDIADYLRQQGAQETVQVSPYGGYEGAYEQTMPQETGPYRGPSGPVGLQIDPNQIQEQMKEFEGLAPALAAVDQNSASEQRAWVMRRLDNRSSLLGAVEKQFGEEMAFVKNIATEEKAQQTVRAIDELTAARKERYEAIDDALREQRREMLLESRGARGSYPGRGRPSRGAAMQDGPSPYGGYPDRAAVPPGEEDPNGPQLDQQTQSQMQAWVSAKPDDKRSLLDATHSVDLAELGALHKVAIEEQAKKTGVAIMALMMVREQRIAKIVLRWQEEDERMQRMQERYGTQDSMAGRRGRRR